MLTMISAFQLRNAVNMKFSTIDVCLYYSSAFHNIKYTFTYIGWLKLRGKCPYLELFWPVFSRIRTEYWPEQLWVWALFMQCNRWKFCIELPTTIIVSCFSILPLLNCTMVETTLQMWQMALMWSGQALNYGCKWDRN